VVHSSSIPWTSSWYRRPAWVPAARAASSAAGGADDLVDHQHTAAGQFEVVRSPPDDDDRGVVRGADEGRSYARLHLLSS
jgi:hypothetical protein